MEENKNLIRLSAHLYICSRRDSSALPISYFGGFPWLELNNTDNDALATVLSAPVRLPAGLFTESKKRRA
jgi:hypothetical protein